MTTFRRLFLILGLVAFANASAGIDDGLLAHYPMDGTADDVSGHGHHGVAIGGPRPTTDRFGAASSAYGFDGLNDYINLGRSLDVPSLSNYSVSVWFLNDGHGQPSCGFGTGYGEKILDKTVYFHDFYIMVCPIGNDGTLVTPPKGFLSFNTYESSGDQIRDDNDAIRDGRWHHVVVTKRGSHGELWVDGVRKGTSDGVRTVFSSAPLLVGYSLSSDDYQRKFFSGKIDDLRIYGRALSASEVGTLYSSSSDYVDVASVADVNGNGSPELAALVVSPTGQPRVVIKDTATWKVVREIAFGDPGMVAHGVSSLLDLNGNGSPELAVLVTLPDGRSRVLCKDAGTGRWIQGINFFGASWQAQSITAQDANLDGVSEIAVLGVKVDGTAMVQIRDALTPEQVKWMSFTGTGE